MANMGQMHIYTGDFTLFFTFLCKCINDAPSNVPSSMHIIISYIIFASCDVALSCDMMTSLMMSSHTCVAGHMTF